MVLASLHCGGCSAQSVPHCAASCNASRPSLVFFKIFQTLLLILSGPVVDEFLVRFIAIITLCIACFPAGILCTVRLGVAGVGSISTVNRLCYEKASPFSLNSVITRPSAVVMSPHFACRPNGFLATLAHCHTSRPSEIHLSQHSAFASLMLFCSSFFARASFVAHFLNSFHCRFFHYLLDRSQTTISLCYSQAMSFLTSSYASPYVRVSSNLSASSHEI